MPEQDPNLAKLPVPEPMPDGAGPAAIDLSSAENAHIQEAILERGRQKARRAQ